MFDKSSLALLSIISKKTMIMVRSLGFKANFSMNFRGNSVSLYLRIGSSFLLLEMRYDDASNNLGTSLPTGIFICSGFPNEKVECLLNINQPSNLFKAEGWIKNVKCAFNAEEVDVHLSSHSNFCIRSISDVMSGVRINQLRVIDDPHFFSLFVDVFHPPPNELFLMSSRLNRLTLPTTDLPWTKKVLIQNFRAVTLDTPVSLNDLLMTNVARLISRAAKLNDKELNFFIKVWLKTKCTKIEHLCLEFPATRGPLNEDVVLKRIGFVKQPDSRVIDFEHARHPLMGTHSVGGGFDITRGDGTTATIVLRDRHFRMIVWI
ncbi:unnamed protein product [Caenorhabditis brenneri]